MALFLNQDNNRTRLQEKISAELNAKLSAKSKSLDGDLVKPEGEDLDPQGNYLKGTKTTGKFAWVWLVAVLVAIIIVVWLTAIS